jgi:hypothetical protein
MSLFYIVAEVGNLDIGLKSYFIYTIFIMT